MAGIDPRLDHLVYVVPELEPGVREIAALLGVDPAPGGRHPGHGTRNYLLGLGSRAYLEIIGPDPEAEVAPRWFGLDTLTVPRLLTWAIRDSGIDATVAAARTAGYDPGEVEAMSRRTPEGGLLEWRLAKREPSARDGLVPFLIDWGNTRHPTAAGLAQVRLLSLRGEHPDPCPVREDLAAIGAELEVEPAGIPGLYARISGRSGIVELT